MICNMIKNNKIVSVIYSFSTINMLKTLYNVESNCRLKPYDFFGRKINLSRISPAKRSRSGPNSVYVDMSRVTVFKKVWARSAHFGQNGAETSPAEFLCDVVNQTNFRKLRNGWFPPNLVTKRSSVSCRGIRKDIFENFRFRGQLSPKSSEIENRSNRHLTRSRLQVTGCNAERYCLLRVVVQGTGSFRNRSAFL